MSFSKITDEMRAGKGNVGQPDTPELTTTEMQEVMDELANLAIDNHNAHIDELGLNTAAGYIGAVVPSGITANENIQSILTALGILTNNVSSVKHTHVNKTVLDSITETVKSNYDALVQLLNGISTVQQTLTASEAAVPTSSAVVAYIAALDISEKAFNAVYPIGTVYETTSSQSPTAQLGYGVWSQIGATDLNGVSRYERIE